MSEKHPAWTRTRVGRHRVHWVAYDGRSDSGERRVVDQGYAASLAEADAAARSALAAAGMYQARRIPTASGPAERRERGESRRPSRLSRPPGPGRARPREYLYTRHHADQDDGPSTAAHLVLKKTAKRVYVTRRSCGPDQLGTEDEGWELNEPAVALDRASLERDGSVRSGSYRRSEFYATRQAAAGDSDHLRLAAFRDLELEPPCTAGDIKAAYRRRAFEVHPDRGGSPGDFQAVEAASRRLLREAQGPES